MHEMGIALEVARIAREEAASQGGARVTALRVRVGGWSGVDPESLRFSLETLVSPTAAEPDDLLSGCRIDLDLVAPEFSCPGCGLRFAASGYLEACPACGADGAELVAGDELSLVELELEDP
ncbi:MAG: hydrogenase maturation nickel metallochaperone HypA [Deltaproteobacteria bacterium]|nr:hydrogenase maturation nickel metallochaperone HypA [Deltaproteobacteria bacterium]